MTINKLAILKEAIKQQTKLFNKQFASDNPEEFTKNQMEISKLTHELAEIACRGHSDLLLQLVEKITGHTLPRFSSEKVSWNKYALFRIGTSKKIYITLDLHYNGTCKAGILKNISKMPSLTTVEHNDLTPINEEEVTELIDSDRYDLFFEYLANSKSDYLQAIE